MPRERGGRWWRWGPSMAILLLIAAATLTPAEPTRFPMPTLCLVCGELGGVDVLLNFALFFPLGVALALAGVAWWRGAALCLAFTLGIELLQFSIVSGRDASLGDLLTNTLGGATGAALAQSWHSWLLPRPAIARVLSLGAAVIFVSILGTTERLLRPSISHMGFWGQIAPQEHPDFAPWHGTVHSFTVNGHPIPYDYVPSSGAIRRALLSGNGWGHVELTSGAVPDGPSAIARLGSRVHDVFFIGQSGTDLVFRSRLAMRDWLLRLPEVRVRDVFAQPGVPMSIDAAIADRAWLVRVRDARGTRQFRFAFSVSQGWSFLLPFALPLGESYRWLGALWLAALVAPGAYWSRFAAEPRAGAGRGGRLLARGWMVVPALAVAAGIGGVSALASLSPPHLVEWCGALLGIVAGTVLARLARQRWGGGPAAQGAR